jgi:hypothetical protein
VVSALILAFLLSGVHAPRQNSGDRSNASQGVAPVTLTNDRPTSSFALDAQTLASAPAVLKLTLTKVVNPAKLPFEIFVYVSYQADNDAKTSTGKEKILIGNFGLFPPDHPATFSLAAFDAFRTLKAKSLKATGVRLLLEMKRIHESAPWTHVEVTVARPEWQLK